MIHYIFRRTLIAIPTLLVISFIIFAILDLAPNDPTGNLPMTVPPEVRAKIRSSLGLDEPMHIRFGLWLVQFCVNEPLNLLYEGFGISIGDVENRTRIHFLVNTQSGGGSHHPANSTNTLGSWAFLPLWNPDCDSDWYCFCLQTIFLV